LLIRQQHRKKNKSKLREQNNTKESIYTNVVLQLTTDTVQHGDNNLRTSRPNLCQNKTAIMYYCLKTWNTKIRQIFVTLSLHL